MVPESEVIAYGMGYAFESPISFIKLLCTTLVQEADRYVGSLVGNHMACRSDRLISWVVIIMFLLLLWMAVTPVESERMKVTIFERVFCAGILVTEIVGLHILMLIETPIGRSVISGVQGRYFLAWVPIVMLILYDGNRTYNIQGKRRLFFYLSITEIAYLYLFLNNYLGVG